MKSLAIQLLTPVAILIGLIAHGVITKVSTIEIKDDFRPKSISVSGLHSSGSFDEVKSFRAIEGKDLTSGQGPLSEYTTGMLKISENGTRISLRKKGATGGYSACLIPTNTGYLLVEYSDSNHGS